MRTYYVFKINSNLYPIGERRPVSIYKLLTKIKKMNREEYDIAKRVYNKMVLPINKKMLDNYLVMNHMNDIYYCKKNNEHRLCSSYEESKIKIYNTFLKLVTTNNISSFFKDLYSIDNNYFFVDFENNDYFFLSDFKLKLLV